MEFLIISIFIFGMIVPLVSLIIMILINEDLFDFSSLLEKIIMKTVLILQALSLLVVLILKFFCKYPTIVEKFRQAIHNMRSL